jgi:DNA-binding transcriptional LysR family regulator
MKLTLRQMEIFLNVVEYGHLTNVAKVMELSQSAISMSIKELEGIIGKPLFDRINKKLVLNEVGRAFYKEIAPIFKKLKDIEFEFQNAQNKGMIRVGATTTIVDYMMPSIICSYMNSYPDVKITLKEDNTKKIIELIKRGELDVGFVEGYVNDSDIIKEKIGQDELVIVTSSQNLAKLTTLESLVDKRWVLREKGSGTREVFLDHIKNKVDNLNIFFELGHTESIKSIVQQRECVSCISKIAVQKEIRNQSIFQLDIKGFHCTRDLLMIYHKDKYKSTLFDKFVYFAKKLIVQTIV